MFKHTQISPLKIFSTALTMTVTLFALLFSMGASAASTVTVDGVKKAGEYTGTAPGTWSGTESLDWWNGHHSIYTLGANSNDLYWEINDNQTNGFSLNLFVEVPTYARRMVWSDGCEYNGAGCTDSDGNYLIDEEYLKAYQDGSHHIHGGKKEVKMDYHTQTHSEFFELRGLTGEIKWQDEDGNGISDDFTWATSREYLISEGICTTSLCLEYDTTASLELMYLGLASKQAAQDLIDDITDMHLHLSDEARGLPPITAVPIPAAAFMFAPALIGFLGLRRRAKSTAV